MKRLITVWLLGLGLTAFGLQTSLTMENDAFLPGAGDHDYTHGTKLEVVDEAFHYMISQNMYAPSDLKKSEHIKGDRPYCGMLIGGVGYEFFQDPESPWTHYGELDFGMIGPAAGCKWTQKTIHKWLNCKDPKGWDNQLHNEFVVNGQWWTKYHYYITDWAALVPRVGVGAGTIQDFAEAGCDLKIGYNIRKSQTANNTIMFSAPSGNSWQDKLVTYGFVGVGERYYLYNHILEGSLFGHKDDGLDVDIEPFVTEFRAGIVVEYDRFFFTYYAVFRTDEFKHQPNRPDYGGFCVGWTW